MDQRKHMCQLEEPESWSVQYKKKHGACATYFVSMIILKESSAAESFCFKSNAAVKKEKLRHLAEIHNYIIHPFSKLRAIWELIMMFVYSIQMTIVPVEACNAFYVQINRNNFIPVFGPIVMFLHSVTILDIIFSFVTGYIESHTQRVVLEPKLIKKHYLQTYFIFDLLSTVPPLINAIYLYLIGSLLLQEMIMCNFLKIARYGTMTNYMRKFFSKFRRDNASYRIWIIIFRTLVFFHWSACVLFIAPFLITNITVYSYNSWIHFYEAKIDVLTTSDLYLRSVYAAIKVSLTCSPAYGVDGSLNIVLAGTFAIVGLIYASYLYVENLDIIRILLEPETKYDEFITQVKDYNRHNQLPSSIQQRMYRFYEQRYQRCYFSEEAIIQTLSAQINKEIHVHCCLKMIQKIYVFNNMEPAEIKEVIEKFVRKIYLPKDVIVKAGAICRHLYFFSYGTAAQYTMAGKEISHQGDGSYFGDMALLMKDHKFISSLIAIEICEVYLLEKELFLRYISSNIGTYTDMVEKAKWKIREVRAIEASLKTIADIREASKLNTNQV